MLWGLEDPYIGAEFGRAYAAALPNAELVELDGAGHWPWIDRPETVDLVAGPPDRLIDAYNRGS